MHEKEMTETLLDRVRETVLSQGFMQHVGARIDEIARGRLVLSLDRREALLQQHGFFHGGVVAFLIDNTSTAVAGTMVREPGQGCLTAEYKINFLSPAAGDRLICEAEVLKPGRKLTVAESKVWSVNTEEDSRKLCAVGLSTIAILEAA